MVRDFMLVLERLWSSVTDVTHLNLKSYWIVGLSSYKIASNCVRSVSKLSAFRMVLGSYPRLSAFRKSLLALLPSPSSNRALAL